MSKVSTITTAITPRSHAYGTLCCCWYTMLLKVLSCEHLVCKYGCLCCWACLISFRERVCLLPSCAANTNNHTNKGPVTDAPTLITEDES